LLLENERIDDLEYMGLKIIQNKKGFCFGIDSVLLSDYAKNIKNNSKINFEEMSEILFNWSERKLSSIQECSGQV